MPKLATTIILLLFTITASADDADLRDEAMQLVRAFAGELKPALLAAIEAGGPVNAIEVCATKAPDIASKLSRESGWQVRRVSLKPRNAETARPDDWARAVLEDFDRRARAGEPASRLVHAETVDGEFRFLKAQPVEPLCLACHGESLDPAVREKLAEHYHDDRATGYALGDVRGAFYLTLTNTRKDQ